MIKKILALSVLTTGLFFQSCSDDVFGENVLTPVSVNTSVKFTGDYAEAKAVNANVILRNSDTGVEYTATTDANGNVSFPTILPGRYNATVSLELTPEQFENYFGYDSGSDENINFNGLVENITIQSSGTNIALQLTSANTIGGLVLKQIYYGGSSTKEGASFRDQFVEIYNNSGEVLYADGLIFAQLFGNTKIGTESYHLASGQLDWSKGIGNGKGSAANTDYVYGKNVYRIPGDGKTYAVQPGESIIIAATAINHKINYTDNTGKAVGIINSDLTVDLSNADFEANLTSYTNSQFRYDIQNENVPDLEIVHWVSGQDMVLGSTGKESFIIFRATEAEIKDFGKVRNPDGESSSVYLQIPNSKIIDGVDITTDLGNGLTPKKLATSIDVGKTYLLTGAYTSYAVIRKTQKTVNGRIILKDTNNSTEDFVNIKATPKGFAN